MYWFQTPFYTPDFLRLLSLRRWNRGCRFRHAWLILIRRSSGILANRSTVAFNRLFNGHCCPKSRQSWSWAL